MLQNAAVVMGTGLANFINLLNPGIVVLSGPLIMHLKLFYEKCVETALKKSYLSKERNIVFSRGGSFGENSVSIGSAALVIENFLKAHGFN